MCSNCSCSGTTMSNTSVFHNCTAATNTPCSCTNIVVAQQAITDLNIEATFAGSSGWGYSHNNEILISDTTEETFYSVGEWSEYIGAFFNKEKEVSGLAETSRARGEKESAGILAKFKLGTSTKPKVGCLIYLCCNCIATR